MTKHFTLLLFIGLAFWGCESNDEDTTPPTVTITFPQTNSIVFEIVTITCISSDNEGVEEVELWVNGVTTELTDDSEPYSFDWNTTLFDNGNYTITVRSYDLSGNTTDSEPVVLTVNNSLSVPQGGNITSVTYTTTEMTVEWEQSSDGDFKEYKLLYSETESGDKDTLEIYTDKSTTSHTITEFDPLIENWFWVQVTDTLGLSSTGTGMTNEIDSPPTQIDVSSVTNNLNEMIITWKQSNDTDFISYELLYSETQSGEQTSITTITDINTTSYTISDFNLLEERWYWIMVTDYWNLTSLSNGYMVLDNPTTSSVLYPIIYDEGFQISWSQNNDDDFQSYKLYESLSENMSNNILIYETGDRTDTTFFKILQNLRYYQVITEDVWGLQSTSNIEVGDYEVELWGNPYSVLRTDTLRLDSLGLDGGIPSEIGDLINLTHLSLYGNQLTGSIPSEIGNLTNLTYLSLSNNELTGSIPSEIGDLINLTHLSLGSNQLTGEITLEIGNLTNLDILNLASNQLTGSIPSEIGNLTNLTFLNLRNNQLTGSIPSEIGNLTNLTYLYLDGFMEIYNQLTGSIPSEIGNLTNLTYLYLSYNQLTGSIPSEIGNLTNLTFLNLASNQLTGSIPSEIGNITNLTNLKVRDNQLTGSIPLEIGDLTNLVGLDLSYNQLTGSIPPEIGNLTNLTNLNVRDNQLTGSIPSEIGNLTNLISLNLGSNQLSGEIPDSICDLDVNWSFFYFFNISENQLCPTYPSCIEDYMGEQDTSNCD